MIGRQWTFLQETSVILPLDIEKGINMVMLTWTNICQVSCSGDII